MSDDATAATAANLTAAGAGSLFRAEIAATVRLSVPMALTQLGQIAMMTTDLALLGRLSDNYVAATALAHAMLFAAFTVGMGLVSAVAPLAAQAYGARAPRIVRRALRVGLWAGVLAGLPLVALQLFGREILIALGQAPDVADLAGRYLAGLGWSLVPGWIFIALRSFMGAVNRPQPALWITLAAVPANALLAYALIHGEFGLPRLDLLGAGLATTLVNTAMCVAAFWVASTQAPFAKYRILGGLWRFDRELFGRLLVIGLPMSGAFLLEFGVFGVAALLMGWLGTAALAAHQIALQVAAILFMVPFGIAMAATVRVGHAAGRRDAAATRRAGFAALLLGFAFAVPMMAVIAATRHAIPVLFLGTGAAAAPETTALAATLLLVGVSFFVADGVQTIAAGALRGLADTRVPLVMAAVSFWAIGFTSCAWLAFPMRLGAVGIWIGLSLGLFVYAAMLVWRFHALTARAYLPDTPAAASP